MVEITMFELLDRLGLEYTTRGYLYVCPFCGHKKSLRANNDKGMWICPKCKPKSSGRVLHFYARYVCGMNEIPSGTTERGKLSKELQEFMGYSTEQIAAKPIPKPKENPNRIPLAPDEKLNSVYSAMADLPVLKLSKDHRKELLARGLTEEAIDANGYRTMPVDFPNPAPYVDLYQQEGGDKTRQIIFDGWRYPVKCIQLGLMIAASLIGKGLDLSGVPGFYKFGESWCFWVNPGIMIPTRNLKGQIVVWQVRRKVTRKKDPKYVTNHCSDLPGAVTDSVSRCHFPAGNAPLDSGAPFIFTEGPLKADVALCLYGKPVIFGAIPGITASADLLNYVADLRKAGVKTAQNGLDMDKLTNPNVRDGSDKLMKEIRMRGVSVQQLYWGEQYARYKLSALRQIAKLRNVAVPDFGENVYDHLRSVAAALENAGIYPCKSIDTKGNEVSLYWEPATKGIDDYYLDYLRK